LADQRNLRPGPAELDAEEEREPTAQEEHHQAGEQELDADDLVIGREDVFAEEAQFLVMLVLGAMGRAHFTFPTFYFSTPLPRPCGGEGRVRGIHSVVGSTNPPHPHPLSPAKPGERGLRNHGAPPGAGGLEAASGIFWFWRVSAALSQSSKSSRVSCTKSLPR